MAPSNDIRKATLDELNSVMGIVAQTVAEMKTLGNDQWDETYPLADRFQTDIENQALYVSESNGQVIGFITIDEDQAPEYAAISWQGTNPLVIHRVAVSTKTRSKGTATSLINHAETLAQNLGKKSLRVDTHSSNHPMQTFLKNRGFTKAGDMDYHGKSRPFYCYEKLL